MKCFVFLGPPGVGKGTMADMLCREWRFAHVSTGDILRDEMRHDSNLGQQARDYVNSGELVPDQVVAAIVSRRIAALKDKRGLVLDGFPRTVVQAELLDQALSDNQRQLDAAVLFEAGEEFLVRRLTARWLCRDCGAVYNALFHPSDVEGQCDRCGGELYQRSDDRERTVRQRLQVYRRQTEPLIEHYRERGLLLEVSGAGTTEENYAGLLGALSL